MKIVPVIDLMGGLAVHAVGGRRETYLPLACPWLDRPDPIHLGQVFAQNFGFDEIYVADLDAISGREPNWSVFAGLRAAGLPIWIDAGTGTASRAARLAERLGPGDRLIAGLESIAAADEPSKILAQVGPDRLIVGIDMRDGALVTNVEPWRQTTPRDLLREMLQIGIRSFLLLDLAAVGGGSGVPTLDLCRWLRHEGADIEIITGGGVRSRADLEALAAAKVDAALMATALYRGTIGGDEIEALR